MTRTLENRAPKAHALHARDKGYGQYCPIAIAAEVLAERWTPLVIRSLCLGATRFNDIHKSVPRMSSALLSRRLRELEFAGVLARVAPDGGGPAEYRVTPAGEALFPVLESMGFWAQTWLRREITRDENLDPDVLMWEIRRVTLNEGAPRERRRVACFHLDGVPVAKRFYWLVFEPEGVDICVKDPGFEVDLTIEAHIRTLIEIWTGARSLRAALGDESLRLIGPARERRAFQEWFVLSHFVRHAPSSKKTARG